ncbi:hypothetical protein Mgra_00002790 [Meloidogyne graminicola]|uniref:Uncharacterized protein n=1 Tax=Meloidogyne graminicola TaxID=189291 RepID=A0A8S9ZW26_9BILA|nr:hypothetical protein Mgra_00002790 [Meloidogyne graminicola]
MLECYLSFWLFDGLDEEPYGLLPLVNLSGKSGATSTKNVERIGSYQWRLEEDEPIPGMPLESFYWPGGKLRQDHGIIIYNVNHMKVKDGQLDTAILAAKLCSSNNKKKQEINFDDYDVITDAINLQKLFAFGQEAGDGLFRIDCERVGKTVLLSRMEASDLMEIGHLTYDQSMKAKMTKTRSKHCSGPFFQLISYQFGSLKILVRYEVECADFVGAKAEIFEDIDQLPEKIEFSENKAISYINFGKVPDNLPLQLLTTYPHGGGFPFFTWAQMFFTCADQEMIGFWKGNGDFSKPAIYGLNDISKLMKPLPYAVHDCLCKIQLFLVRNDPTFRFGLIWKGKPHLEIFSKSRKADGAISKSVRKFLSTQCKNRTEEEIQEISKKQKDLFIVKESNLSGAQHT